MATTDALRWADLVAIIREDWARNQKDWTRPGFRALAVYRMGAWGLSLRGRDLRTRLGRRLVTFVYRRLNRYVRNHYGIELHRTAIVGRRLYLAHQGAIVIHREAIIGDDCTIRHGVTIGAAAHMAEERAPILGNRVNVGAGAMVLGEITIGDDVRIGPNAVVLTDIPANSTAFGPPARIIKSGPAAAASSDVAAAAGS